MPSGDQYRHLARVFTSEETRLRGVAAAIETLGAHEVFDGVMSNTTVELHMEQAATNCRSAAAMCATLAATCMHRAAVAHEWADHYRRYERALETWRANVERSGAGARPETPARPAPWVDR